MSHPALDRRTAWIGTTPVLAWPRGTRPRSQDQEVFMTTTADEQPAEGGLDTVHIYVDNSGEFRFHRKAPNGRKISDGAEGFPRVFNARRAVLRTYPDRRYRIVRDDTGEVLFDPAQPNQ